MNNKQWYFGFVALITILTLVSCQRFQPMEKREGLDNDSHSYSYMGYNDDRMVRAARSVDEVEDAVVSYNGRNLIMKITVRSDVSVDRYPSIKQAVQKKVSATSPVNPFHIKMIKKDDQVKPHG